MEEALDLSSDRLLNNNNNNNNPVIAAVLRDAIEVTASFFSPQILWVVSGAEQLILLI